MSTKEEIKKGAKEIETLYQEYIGKIDALKAEQAQILAEFLHKLEERKLTEIRNLIKN